VDAASGVSGVVDFLFARKAPGLPGCRKRPARTIVTRHPGAARAGVDYPETRRRLAAGGSTTMRAIAIEQFGGPETLKLTTLPDPTPQAGEVLVRVVAAGVNPIDWKIRDGFLAKLMPHRFPLVLGWDAAGVVEATGPGASRFRRGDAVWTYARKPEVQAGTYAELLAVPETSVGLKPASMFFHEAAAVPLVALTAYQALLRAGDVRPGTPVLVHAAAGGVGHLGVQIAKSVGARVLGTASGANLAYVKSLGVDHVIDYRAGDFRDQVRKLYPEGVQVALDTVGGDVLTHSFDVVAKGGRLVSIAGSPDAAEADKRGVRAHFHFVEPSAVDLDALRALADAGKLTVHVSALYGLADAAAALDKSREGRTKGKIVLVV
jgi:NADPH2:quinone reductase